MGDISCPMSHPVIARSDIDESLRPQEPGAASPHSLSSRRKPGPITTAFGGERDIGRVAQRCAVGVMGPGFRRDDGGDSSCPMSQRRHCEDQRVARTPRPMTGSAMHPISPPSSPAHAGDPVRCGLSDQSRLPLAYWIARLRGCGFAFSRHHLSEICISFRPHLKGAGKAGCRSHPWIRCRGKSAGVGPQVRPKNTPAFPARWATAYACSPRRDWTLLSPSASCAHWSVAQSPV